MTEPSRPKLNRLGYAAALLGAMAVAAIPLAYPATATAQKYWDIELFDACKDMTYAKYQAGQIDFDTYHWGIRKCCEDSDGVWNSAEQECVAPPGDSQGSRQFPGNVQIPSDIATSPALTKGPPIRVPSDLATVSTVGQGNELAS